MHGDDDIPDVNAMSWSQYAAEQKRRVEQGLPKLPRKGEPEPEPPTPAEAEAAERTEGHRLAEEGAQRAYEAKASQEWIEVCKDIMFDLAYESPEVLSDEIHRRNEVVVKEKRGMAGVVKWGKRHGLIAATGEMVKKTRKVAHAGDQRVYRSLVFGQPKPARRPA